jgi:hypothetical protein
MKLKGLPVLPAALQVRLAFAGSWKRAMCRKTILGWLMLISPSLLLGCSSGPMWIGFQHNYHRQVYSFNEEDLKKLQFSISTEVVAQFQDSTGTKSILIHKFTPGVVTSAGPNWLKVSFREGGVDIPFVTDLSDANDRYWLATEIEGSKDFKKVIEVPQRIFRDKGARYTVVNGADAVLLVDWEEWQKLVETRKATEGRKVEGK